MHWEVSTSTHLAVGFPCFATLRADHDTTGLVNDVEFSLCGFHRSRCVCVSPKVLVNHLPHGRQELAHPSFERPTLSNRDVCIAERDEEIDKLPWSQSEKGMALATCVRSRGAWAATKSK